MARPYSGSGCDVAVKPDQQTAYSQLRNSKTVILPVTDYDVFGDGTVVIKCTPGHTPGHQVLALRLPKPDQS